MGSSLQQGIDAAKAGKLGLALEHLKNAVVEEPENPEVWVWFSGIIDDEEKQIIFLKKALELDPDNRSAQRGLAYLQRQKYVPSQHSASSLSSASGKSLTNAEDEIDIDYPDPDFMTLNVQSFAKQVDALGDPNAPSRKEIIQEQKSLAVKGKKPWLDILIYGLTLIVFTVIGVLIGATIKNRKTVTPEPKQITPIVENLPGEGVFLTYEGQFYKIELSHNEPADGPGLPSTNEKQPTIRAKTSVMFPEKLKLIDKKRGEHSFNIEELEDQSVAIKPDKDLSPGRYCLIHPLSEENQALYWCFNIID